MHENLSAGVLRDAMILITATRRPRVTLLEITWGTAKLEDNLLHE